MKFVYGDNILGFCVLITILPGGGGGGGKARFNVATPTNATVTCKAYVLPYNLQTKSI